MTLRSSTERLIVYTLVVGLVFSGIAFAFKLAAFAWAMSSEDIRGTFDVGITVYAFVSLGWLFLLVWCLRTGKFREMERSKMELFRKEAEYERLGI